MSLTKINYWKSAKVPTVQYGARDVSLTLTTECEPELVKESYERLKAFVDREVEDEAKRIAFEWGKDTSHLRIREKDGKRYPSVTTILNDKPYDNDPAYGVRGNFHHDQFNNWINTGVILKPALIDIGKLEWLDFEKFIKIYSDSIPRKNVQLNVEVFNERLMYSGEIDYLGKTLDDLKTGQWKLAQLCAYNECLESPRVVVRILDLKNQKIHEFERHSKEYNEAWESFLIQRGEFKNKWGI